MVLHEEKHIYKKAKNWLGKTSGCGGPNTFALTLFIDSPLRSIRLFCRLLPIKNTEISFLSQLTIVVFLHWNESNRALWSQENTHKYRENDATRHTKSSFIFGISHFFVNVILEFFYEMKKKFKYLKNIFLDIWWNIVNFHFFSFFSKCCLIYSNPNGFIFRNLAHVFKKSI